MRNNANPSRRAAARDKVGIAPEVMARWPLFDVVSKGMKPTKDYAPGTLSAYRKSVRVYQQFIGHEQSPINVTEKKFEQFKLWLSDSGYSPAHQEVLQECLAAVVRFADGTLLPSRGIAARPVFADAETPGSIEWHMVHDYFEVNGAIVSDSTRRNYGAVAIGFTRYLGRVAMLSDLNNETFRRWVGAMQRGGKRPATIRSYATTLRAFWSWAVGRKLVDEEPGDDLIPSNPSKSIKQKLDPCGIGALSRFVDRYFAGREVCPDYETKVRKRVAKLARFAGSVSIEEVFDLDVVNGFLRSIVDRSPYTVKDIRSDIVTLWNAAADEDLVGVPPLRKIIKPKCHELIIECYSADEVRQLLAAARGLKGHYPTGVAKATYWVAMIMLAWDGGLRRGDCWRFRKSLVQPDGTLRVVQHKTKQAVTVRLRESTRKAIDLIPFDKAFSWEMAPDYFGRHFKAIVQKSGVNRGSFKWLRRSSGSYVELQMPGAGTKHLGHKTAATFTKHYDGRLGGHTLPMPPSLDVTEAARPIAIDVDALAFM